MQMGHIKNLENGTAKYLLRRVNCKMSHTYENPRLDDLPKRVVLCCIDIDAYNKYPSSQKHKHFNFLALYVDGQQVPTKPRQPRFQPLSAPIKLGISSVCYLTDLRFPLNIYIYNIYSINYKPVN